MRRLQIIDLAGGHQPMSAADGRYHIVFNGEIYNYRELREVLAARGAQFQTQSDTEVLLQAYVQFGRDCVAMLRGMFAFAIWDDQEKSLFMARDRFGKKPLHFLEDGQKLVFGSEIKSILQHPEVVARVHRPAIVDYLAYGTTLDPQTMFDGIAKVPPGNTLFWSPAGIRIQPYWDFEFAVDPTLAEDKALRGAEDVIREAVRVRLVSDVPLGAFLSGGIDSSLVVAMMATQMSEPVKTFSIGFDSPEFNELPYARLVAQRYGTDHHEEVVKPDAEEILPYLVNVFDEPFADSSAIPTYYVSRLAKRHVTVALSGDGGDELFGGYSRYLDSRQAQDLDRRIPGTVRGAVHGVLSRFCPPYYPGAIRLREYFAPNLDHRYIMKVSKGLPDYHERIFSPRFVAEVGSGDPSPSSWRYLDRVAHLDPLARRQYLDIKTYLPADIMTKVDRTSMLASLECRAPLLDQEVAAFAATLPPHFRIQGRSTKFLLKKLGEKYLPHELIHRPKMGFAIPINHWINSEWRDLSQDLVLSRRALKRDNFRPRFLETLMAEHRRNRRDHSGFIWTLMVLEMWYRKFIDGETIELAR
jgi:asparagine synthase (glutamine-hydrolysing)